MTLFWENLYGTVHLYIDVKVINQTLLYLGTVSVSLPL